MTQLASDGQLTLGAFVAQPPVAFGAGGGWLLEAAV